VEHQHLQKKGKKRLKNKLWQAPNIKAFLDNIAHIPCPRDLQEQNPQPRSVPHGFNHDIHTLPGWPDFHRNSTFSTDKNEGQFC
jgi:hypothetical protein